MEYKFKAVAKTKDKHEYEVKVDYKELEPFIEQEYQRLSKNVKITGFRPGKAPRAKIEAEIGSDMLMGALNKLLPEVAFQIMEQEKSKPTGAPDYDLKKVEQKEGIEFNFSFVNYPDVKLGDFSKIKIEKEEAKVTAEDIDMVIKNIVRQNLTPEKIKELTKVTETKPKKEKAKKSEENEKTSKKKVEKEVPTQIEDFELNEELIAELKMEQKNLKEVRAEVETRLLDVKKEQIENDYTQKVLEEAIKISKFEMPISFVESEVKSMEQDFASRLQDLKLDIKTFLEAQGTSLEEKRKEWEKQSELVVGRDLVLINLANEHKLVATDEEVQAEIDTITEPQVKERYKSQSAREYVRTVMTRQKGMDKLLELVEGKEKKAKN